MTPQDARRHVAEALTAIVPDADIDGLAEDASLRDELELDSLDFLSFVEQLSTRAQVRIDETDYPELATLGSSVAFVVNRTAGG